VVAFAGGHRAPFARYWLSGFLSDFGDGVRLAAFPLLAAQITRSPTAVAAVTAVQGLPWLLVGAGLGVLVDRTDRRRLMVAVNIAQAVVIAALAGAIATHHDWLVFIYVTALVTGVAAALRATAAVTCVPRLVDPDDLDRANGRVIAGSIVGSELAGPAAGGWLFGLAAVLPFAVNAGALGIAILLLLTLPSVFRPVPAEGEQTGRTSLAALRRDLPEGIRWLWRQRAVPAGLLGRVSSLYSTVARGGESLGALAGGAVAASAGIRAPMLAGAVPIAATAVWLAWRHRARGGKRISERASAPR
jgi:MFS family permease